MVVNIIGIWLHTDGRDTPNFNSSGHIVSGDRTGTLIRDLGRFLDHARTVNILVFIVLWNGATRMPPRYRQTYTTAVKSLNTLILNKRVLL